jgi:hypothetical protein
VTATSLARRERGTILVQETVDRAMLRAFLETDRLYAAYALCDLDDREFVRTRWGVAFAGGRPISVVLQYAGYSPQPIFVMGENDGIEAILANVIKPRTAYVAARREHLEAISASYRVDPGPAMQRMWVDAAHFRPLRSVSSTGSTSSASRRGCPPAPSPTASTTASEWAADWFRRRAPTS